jgi:hypothetical protein
MLELEDESGINDVATPHVRHPTIPDRRHFPRLLMSL